MADKSVTIKRVSEQPPGEFGNFKSYKVETTEGDVIQIVLPKDAPPPKKDESVFGNLKPPKEGTSFPPSLWPANQKGKGGGGRPQKSDKEINEETARSALIRATELAVAEQIEVDEIVKYTRQFHAALKELAG